MIRTSLPALLMLCSTALADDPPVIPTTPAEKLAALKKQQEEGEAAVRKEMLALLDTPEGQKKAGELYKSFDAAQAARFAAAVEIAKADPKSDAGFAALEWVLTIPRAYHLPAGISAMQIASEHHAASPKIAKMIAWLGYYPPHPDQSKEGAAAAGALIRAVADKNTDRSARGQAMMALAWEAGRKFAVAEYKRTPDVDKLAAEAEKAFEVVVKDYADCPRMMRDGQRTLGEEAKQELYELQNLRIGKTAPEVEAEGMSGAKFKLSDHRGKVTVLVFWASWCGPCMAMVPHERELVERMKDKPFVLVGVNGDGDREKAKETMTKEKMTWPSFWNGPKDGDGPISHAWNVRGWPTVYILDAKGAIRFKNVIGKELDKAVDELLKEMQDEKKKP
jgi:thiol-disulfide isomerase/thioredoxin